MPTDKDNVIVCQRSQEVQELLGHIPGGFMRHGIGIIFILLVAALLVCNFIPYAEVKSFPVRVLPNVPAEDIRSPYDGHITYCHVGEGAMVSAGDTLLTVFADGKQQALKATTHGKVRLCSFCVTNETVRKGQTLMEILQQDSTAKPLLAIADTLTLSVSVQELQAIDVNLCGQKIPFKIVRTIEDKGTGVRQALFQSEKRMEMSQSQRAEGKIVINRSTLLDRLVQTRR